MPGISKPHEMYLALQVMTGRAERDSVVDRAARGPRRWAAVLLHHAAQDEAGRGFLHHIVAEDVPDAEMRMVFLTQSEVEDGHLNPPALQVGTLAVRGNRVILGGQEIDKFTCQATFVGRSPEGPYAFTNLQTHDVLPAHVPIQSRTAEWVMKPSAILNPDVLEAHAGLSTSLASFDKLAHEINGQPYGWDEWAPQVSVSYGS